MVTHRLRDHLPLLGDVIRLPAISVLMPVYNSQRYVARAVESILGQTFKDFELVIVDDGSTDRSLEILRTYAARDRRIRLTTRPNRGISPTRNELLRQARGALIAPMDSDDVALPCRLAREAAFLGEHPEVVCIGGSYRIIDEADRLIHRGFPVAEHDEEIQRLMLVGHCSLHQPTVMYRHAAAQEVGGYDERMPVAEDMDLWLRLGEVGKLANLPEPVLDYRVHANSVSDRMQQAALIEIRRACERAWKRRGITGTVEVMPWRASEHADSRHEFFVRFGWWAFNSGQRRTAGIYALRAIGALPLGAMGWRLLACAVLKRAPFPTGIDER